MIGSSVVEVVSDELTRLATARAAEVGMPTQALEDWRYVRCETLVKAEYDSPREITPDERRQFVDTATPAVVFIDGHLLDKTVWPSGWQNLETNGEEALAQVATERDVAAIWALASGGSRAAARITGTSSSPVEVINLATGGRSGWTLLLEVAPGARLDLIVRHQALGAARSCPALTLRVGRGAQVFVSEVQTASCHHLLATATIDLAADAQVHWTTVVRGGACVRLTTRATLSGPGAHLELAGLSEVSEQHQAHQVVRVVHAAGHTTSDQLFKAILHDRAQTSFDGLVQISSGSDGADAKQQNRNLLLSPLAKADTRPQLDIKADDVKAAHGATVGQLDVDELFYLRCRGLARQDAEALLTIGFAGEVLARLPHRGLLNI